MDSYTLHLAMAALVGSSFVALSAYCMHRKTLNQLLQFARAVERERERERDGEREREYDCSDAAEVLWKQQRRGGGGDTRRKGTTAATYGCASASLQDVAVMSGMVEEVDDGRCNGVAVEGISAGLKGFLTLPEGKDAAHSPVAKRSSAIMRPTSPKSPGASASAFESMEGSDDEENITDHIKLDVTYLHPNGNTGPESKNYPTMLLPMESPCR